MYSRVALFVPALIACSGGEPSKDSNRPDTDDATDSTTDSDTETEDTATTTFPGTARVVDMGTEADAKVLGEPKEHNNSDLRVGRGGDVNGDGLADLLLSRPDDDSSTAPVGRGYIVFGPVFDTIRLADADVILDGAPDTVLGKSINAVGDLNADGLDDVAIGQDGYEDDVGQAGRVILLFSPVTRSGDVEDVGSVFLVGESSSSGCGSNAGSSVAAGGDINDDGFADLLVGSTNIFSCYQLGGGYVVYGPITSDVALATQAGARFPDASLGGEIAGAGDTNGDGFDDVVIGVSFDDPAALLYYGPTHGDAARIDADVTYVAPDGAFAGAASTAAGDVNGDGYQDLLVSQPTDDEAGEYAGAAFLVYGPTGSGRVELDTVDTKLLGIRESTTASVDLDGTGDVDGDGFADILVGAPDYSGQDAGMAFLVLGPTYGTRSLADADLVFLPDGGEDHAGASLAGAGDVDGDGLPDLLIGGPGDDDGGTYAGAAWLFYAGNLW